MTTAARPTWAPAKGGSEQGGTRIFGPSQKYSSRDIASHTTLKPSRNNNHRQAETTGITGFFVRLFILLEIHQLPTNVQRTRRFDDETAVGVPTSGAMEESFSVGKCGGGGNEVMAIGSEKMK
nr:protein CWC15 homolog [Ipomoea batatas]